MAQNILSMMSSFMNQGMVSKASAALGEPESAVGAAFRAAGPALLAGTIKQASSPTGMASLLGVLTSSGIDEGIGSRGAKIFEDAGGMKQILSKGESLLSGVLGNRSDGVASAISQVAGVKPASALKVLAFAGPMLFGFLKNQVGQRGLNAAGIAATLGEQKDSLLRAGVDERITSAMGITDLRDTVDSFGQTATRHVGAAADTAQNYTRAAYAKPRKSWLPLAIGAAVAALALAAVLSLLNRDRGRDEAPLAAVRAPATQERAGLPASVYFDANQATIDVEDRRTIAAAADSAEATGAAVTVTITPLAPSATAADPQLIAQRAATVRDALISEGVAADKIVLRPAEVRSGAEPGREGQRIEIALLTPTDRAR